MIGIIGGSGFEDPKILKKFEEKKIRTPFGNPSSPVAIGEINSQKVAILSRHGKKHSISPSNVNYRANIWALKKLGVTEILAASACGSLREEIKPGHIVFPDQFIDRTTKRAQTFFDKGKVAHIPMAEPFCPRTRNLLAKTAKKIGLSFHEKGTVVTIEGPRFSTRAESNLFRSWKADVINMTTVPECILAREAGICYQVAAVATDFDSWHEKEENVNIEVVLKAMKENASNVKRLFIEALPEIKKAKEKCFCKQDIKTAVL